MTTQSVNRPSIQSLKNMARLLADKEKIALNQALNLIANDYGFTHWPLLMKHFNAVRLNNPEAIWRSFYSGEMMLLSALEGAGKLSMALNLACIALQEDIKVDYITIHSNRDLVHERFNMIIGDDPADCFIRCGSFKIIDVNSDEESLLSQLKLIKNNTLVIIDYLQAVGDQYKESKNYETLLRSLKELTKEKNLRLLMLSQATNEGNIQLLDRMGESKKLFRHFSHYLHLNHADDNQTNGRELTLIKSTHYQHHEALLSLSKKTFRFS